jgi:hypothetical protein
MATCSDSVGWSSRTAITAFASSILPLCASHLGDSGKQYVKPQMRIENMIGIDSDSLQHMEVPWRYDSPKLTQLAKAIPEAMKIPITTTL